MLEVETRNFKGPRTYEAERHSAARATTRRVIKERIYLDKTNPNILHDEITTIDHALTRPWTVMKNYQRDPKPIWYENLCSEDNRHVTIGKQDYCPQLRRLSDAGQEGPAAARSEIFQADEELRRSPSGPGTSRPLKRFSPRRGNENQAARTPAVISCEPNRPASNAATASESTNADDAGRPAEPVEDLAEHGAADQSAEK